MKLSETHVFGLNDKDVEQEHERKNWSYSFKPFNTLSESMKTKWSRAFSMRMDVTFKNEIPNFYDLSDQPVLQEIRFNVQNKNYLADYRDKNEEKENQRIDAFTKVIDQGPISREAYRNLAALQPELPRDRAILNARKRINEKMSQEIPISILDIKNTPNVSMKLLILKIKKL